MATEQEWKVAEKARDHHLVEIEEKFVVDKQKSRRVEWEVTQKQQEVQQTVQWYQDAEEARATAAKGAVESKGREAAVETSREGGC